ncbi:hypothetical protein LL946_05920 [Knoellia locipacati]|uniref:hypothetical protein n=1 Tax=Knoellia locipacati TaxID=882824 RepID=UPI003850BC03
MMKSVQKIAAAGALAAAMTIAGSAPAHAGTEMNGYYPWVKGCDADQAIVDSRPVWDKYGRYVGQVELWWSGRCATNWVRVAPNNPNGMGLSAGISNVYGKYSGAAKDYSFGYSGMLYSPSWSPCVSIDIVVSAGPWSNTYNDPAPRYTIC